MKTKRNLLVKFLNLFKTPSGAMICTWLIWLLLYTAIPFYYTNTISSTTTIFIVLCIGMFCAGDSFAIYGIGHIKLNQTRIDKNLEKSQKLHEVDIIVDHLVQRLAILGILGGTMVVVSKIFLAGLDFTQGISGARVQRANDLISGMALSTPIALYPGLFAFPFGTCAVLICILQGENLSRVTQKICKIAVLSPIAVAIINGGRGGLIFLLLMLLGAFALHLYTKNTLLIPSFRIGKNMLPLIGSFLAYNIYVFESRREVTMKEDFWLSLDNWQSNYGIYPASWLLDLVSSGQLDGNMLLNWMQTHFYFTSGPPVLSRILDSDMSVGPFFGQFQIGVLASFLGKMIPFLSLRDKIDIDLDQLNISGLIPSSWGMMLLDFGWGGTLIEAFLLGWLSRKVYNAAINQLSLSSQLMFCFVFASILLNPIIPPLGFTDNAFTFVSLIVTCSLLRKIENMKYG
jgi:oligosaccharide repeat unit polymerase